MTDTPRPEKASSARQPPLWAWWTAGIAIPVIGILVSILLAISTAPAPSGTIANNSGALGESETDLAEEPAASTNTTAPSPSESATASQDTVEGTLRAEDGDWANLNDGYLVSSFDGRADFRVVKDLDAGVITLLGDSAGQLAEFAVIEDEVTEQNCYDGLRSRKDWTYDLNAESEGLQICVQTMDEHIAAITIDRVDMLEGTLDFTYIVWL